MHAASSGLGGVAAQAPSSRERRIIVRVMRRVSPICTGSVAQLQAAIAPRGKSRRWRYGDAAQVPLRLLAKMPNTSSNPMHLFYLLPDALQFRQSAGSRNDALALPFRLMLLTTI
jgi:hypothetical protein